MHKYNNYRAKIRIIDEDALAQAEQTLAVMLDVVKDVENTGDSFAKACRKYGIDGKRFYQILRTESFKTCMNDPREFEEPVYSEYIDHCLWFYRDFLQDDNFNAMPDDSEETILFVIRSLNEKSQDVIRMRYGIAMPDGPVTLAEIGRKYGLTRERIRQIIQKAFNKIRTTENRKILLMGIAKYSEECKQMEERSMQYPSIKKKKAEPEDTDSAVMYLKLTPIEEIGFSTRTLNGLRRLGISNAYDVIRMNDEDLLTVDNIGIGCLSELRKVKTEFCKANSRTIQLAFPNGKTAGDEPCDVVELMQNTMIQNMHLSTRSFHALKNAGICTLYDLMQKNNAEIYSIRDLGTLSCGEIIGRLEEFCREHGIERKDFLHEMPEPEQIP